MARTSFLFFRSSLKDDDNDNDNDRHSSMYIKLKKMGMEKKLLKNSRGKSAYNELGFGGVCVVYRSNFFSHFFPFPCC